MTSHLIPDPDTYFRQMVPPRDSLLERLEAQATAEKIPIVGPVVGSLLALLVRLTQARKVLELGCATGYSAIYMARPLAARGGELTTIENDPDMAADARENFRQAGIEGAVRIVVGDAETEVQALEPFFDLVFLDIDKEGYRPLLPQIQRLLKPGGLLVADNVAFKGAADFNQAVFESPDFEAVFLHALLPFHSPEKDALCLAVRV